MRSPAPFSFPGFAAFNGEYAAILKEWGLFVNGINPVARTNVAPVVRPPSEPVLYGFSYTRPCVNAQPPTFVVAGAGELPEGILAAESIVALGDTSPRGITTKAAFVMDLMERRLHGLGADWSLVNAIDVYTVHSLDTILQEVVLNRAGPAGVHGVRWHYTRPPDHRHRIRNGLERYANRSASGVAGASRINRRGTSVCDVTPGPASSAGPAYEVKCLTRSVRESPCRDPRSAWDGR